MTTVQCNYIVLESNCRVEYTFYSDCIDESGLIATVLCDTK